MKKIYVTFLILLLSSLLVFSGCTKSSKATPEKIYLLYTDIATEYNGTKNARIFDGIKIDLASDQAYTANVYNKISYTNGEASYSYLNMLKENAEYDTILKAASCFYNNRSIDATYKEIPQNLVSQLYEEVDALNDVLKYLVKQKSVLETVVNNFLSSYKTSIIVSAAFEDYTFAYGNLINQLYKINSLTEKIYTNYVVISTDYQSEALMSGELQRLVLSSTVYFGEYYYIKHLLLNDNYINCFGYSQVTNNDNQVMDNEYYDTGFEKLKSIISNLNNISNPSNSSNGDFLTYYNYGLDKLKTLRTNIENYRIAAQKVRDYKNSHPEQEIGSDNEVYYYYNFVKDMDDEIVNFQNYLILNIIK